MYDGDKPGIDAAKNLQNMIKGIMFSNIIEMEADKDPGKLTYEEVQKIKGNLYG
jgi:DNA primase